MIKLILPGEPIAQARVRVFKRGNKVMTFDPQSALKKELKDKVRDQLEGMNWTPPEFPRAMFWFYMPIPKSMRKADRQLALKEVVKHVKKPDVDNLIKLYLDVLTGTAINDDNAVSIGTAIKVYSMNPCTVIYLEACDKILTLNEVWEGTWPTQHAV